MQGTLTSQIRVTERWEVPMADLDFAYDLTLDEARRRTAVLEAIGDDWDGDRVTD